MKISTRLLVSLTAINGFSISQTKLEKFCLYLLYIESVGCSYFMDTYVWSLFIGSFIFLPWQFVGGYIVDQEERHVTTMLTRTAVVQAAVYVAIFLVPLFTRTAHYSWVLIFWALLRFMIDAFHHNCVWKYIKLQLDCTFADDLLAQNHVVNRIGILADIISYVFDSCTLLAMLYITHTSSYDNAKLFLFSVLGFDHLMIAVLSWNPTINTDRPQSPARARTSDDDDNNDNAASAKNGATTTAALLASVDQSVDAFAKEKTLHQFDWSMFDIASQVRQLRNSAVAMNVLSHSFIVYFFWQMVNYPLSLHEAVSFADAVDERPEPANYCGGVVINLLEQGLSNNVLYLIGSLLYLSFVAKTKPSDYFRWVYPAFASVLLVVTVLFFFNLSKQTTWLCLSVLTVCGYYLNMYDFYLCTSAIEEEYYGVVSSLYYVGNECINFVPNLLLLLFPDGNRNLFLFLCASFLVISIIFSLSFSSRHRGELYYYNTFSKRYKTV